MAAPFNLRFEPYDPDARDGDGDGIVQERTIWERPAGTRYLDSDGSPLEAGLTGTQRPPGSQLVDRDGNTVNYKPSTEQGTIGQPTKPKPQKPKPVVEKPVEGSTPLAEHGAPSLKDIGLASVRQIIAGPPPPEPEKPEKKPKPEKPEKPEKPKTPKAPKVPRSDKPPEPPEPSRYPPEDPKRPWTVLYHGTGSSATDSIIRNGLLVSTPGASSGIGEEERAGVYLGDTVDEALEYGDRVFAVLVTDVDSDPSTGHKVVREPIPPSRVRRVWDLDAEEEYKKGVEEAWRLGLPYPDPPEDRTVPENQLPLPFYDELDPGITRDSISGMGIEEPVPPRRPYEPSPPWASGSGWIGQQFDAEGFRDRLLEEGYVVIDYETTGLGADGNMPVQVALVKIKNGQIVDRKTFYMNPGSPLGDWARRNLRNSETGEPLTDEFLRQQMSLREAHQRIARFVGDSILVAHNMPFDGEVLGRTAGSVGVDWMPKGTIDTLELIRQLVPRDPGGVNGPRGHGLNALAEFFGVVNENPHDAASDALTTHEILLQALSWRASGAGAGIPGEEKIFDPAAQAQRFEQRQERFAEELSSWQEQYEQYLMDLEDFRHAVATGNEATPVTSAASSKSGGVAVDVEDNVNFSMDKTILVEDESAPVHLSKVGWEYLASSWVFGRNMALDAEYREYLDTQGDVPALTREEFEAQHVPSTGRAIVPGEAPDLISKIQVIDRDGIVIDLEPWGRQVGFDPTGRTRMGTDAHRNSVKALIAARMAARMKTDPTALTTRDGRTVLWVDQDSGKLTLRYPGREGRGYLVDPATPGYQRLLKEAAVSELVEAWANGANGNRVADAMHVIATNLFGLRNSRSRDTANEIFDERSETPESIIWHVEAEPVLKEFLELTYADTQEMLAANGIRSIVGFRGARYEAAPLNERLIATDESLDDPLAPTVYYIEEDAEGLGYFAEELVLEKMQEVANQILDEDPSISPQQLADEVLKRTDTTGKREIPVELRPMTSWAASEREALQFGNSSMGGVNDKYGIVIQSAFPAEKIISSSGTGIGCLEEDEFVVLGHDIQATMEVVDDGAMPGNSLEGQEALGLLLRSRYQRVPEGQGVLPFGDELDEGVVGEMASGDDDFVSPVAAVGRPLGYVPAEPEGDDLEVRETVIELAVEDVREKIAEEVRKIIGLTPLPPATALQSVEDLRAYSLSLMLQAQAALDEADMDIEDVIDEIVEVIIGEAANRYEASRKAPLMVACPPEAIAEMLGSGRYKSQFETGTSMGSLSPAARKLAEYEASGVPRNLDPQLRPVYGFPHTSSDSPVETEVADAYGGAVIELKNTPEVRARTTVSFSDSLGAQAPAFPVETEVGYLSDEELLAWLRNPHDDFPNFIIPIIAAELESLGLPVTISPLDLDDRMAGQGDYGELQIHGGFSLGDVEAIHLADDQLREISSDTVRSLNENGIKVLDMFEREVTPDELDEADEFLDEDVLDEGFEREMVEEEPPLPGPADFPIEPPSSKRVVADVEAEKEQMAAWAEYGERLKDFAETSGVPLMEPVTFTPFGAVGGETFVAEVLDEGWENPSRSFVKRFTAMLLAKQLTDRGVDLSSFHEANGRRIWKNASEPQDGQLVLVYDNAAGVVTGRFRLVESFSVTSKPVVDPADPNFQEYLNRAIADEIVDAWAQASSSEISMTARGVAQEIFGLDTRLSHRDYAAFNQSQREAVQSVVEEMYRQTQSLLSDGPEELTLLRGMKVAIDREEEFAQRVRKVAFEHVMKRAGRIRAEAEQGSAEISVAEILQQENSLLQRMIGTGETWPGSGIVKEVTLEYILRRIDRGLNRSDVAGFVQRQTLLDWDSLSEAEQKQVKALFDFLTSIYRDAEMIPADEIQDIELDAMSSFSFNPTIARMFGRSFPFGAGVVGAYKVPRQRILGIAGVGFGDWGEREAVVLGGGRVSGVHSLLVDYKDILPIFLKSLLTDN